MDSILFLILLCSLCASSHGGTRTREDILNELFTKEYDESIPPNYNEEIPTVVNVQMFIIHIHSVSETEMEFKAELILKQKWVDNRLSFNFTDNNNSTNTTGNGPEQVDDDYLELSSGNLHKVWEPDTFFYNQRVGQILSVTTENKLIHIHSDGTIVHSIRVALTLSCEMFLHRYPNDKQNCPIIILSYAYNVRNIIYRWYPRPVIFQRPELPQFSILVDEITLTNDTDEYDATGLFSRLKVSIPLQRKVGYYVLQIFVPSTLVVVISWTNFWLDKDAVSARASIGIVTVLTITTLSSSARSELPPVSYVKAIDVWLFVCTLFVFFALLQFAYVNMLTRRLQRYIPKTSVIEADEAKTDDKDTEEAEETTLRKVVSSCIKCLYPGYRREARYYRENHGRLIDHMSRRVFPAAYFLFLIIFFAYISSDDVRSE